MDDEPINYKPLYIVAGLVLAPYYPYFPLYRTPLWYRWDFYHLIAGAFYLGKTQEVRKAKSYLS